MEFAVTINVEPHEVADLINKLDPTEGRTESGVRRAPNTAGDFIVHVSKMHTMLTNAAVLGRSPSTIESPGEIATALLREAGVLG